jgi:hypothetical protein
MPSIAASPFTVSGMALLVTAVQPAAGVYEAEMPQM